MKSKSKLTSFKRYDNVDEEWKASDVYEALLLEESKEDEPQAEVVTQPVESEGMTAEEQESS